MKTNIPVKKIEDEELPIPIAWRRTFNEIVEEFRTGNFKLEGEFDSVFPINDSDANRIDCNIKDYDDELIPLPEQTWRTSTYRWMGDYWQVLIDLFTVREGASDLVMFVRVYEHDGRYCFEIESVHVP
jgi:hypothetical protein